MIGGVKVSLALDVPTARRGHASELRSTLLLACSGEVSAVSASLFGVVDAGLPVERLPRLQARRPQVGPHLVHALEREPTRLGDEEEDEQDTHGAAAAKHESVLGANLVGDGRGEVADQEVPDPVRGHREGDALCPDVRGKQFSGQDPRPWSLQVVCQQQFYRVARCEKTYPRTRVSKDEETGKDGECYAAIVRRCAIGIDHGEAHDGIDVVTNKLSCVSQLNHKSRAVPSGVLYHDDATGNERLSATESLKVPEAGQRAPEIDAAKDHLDDKGVLYADPGKHGRAIIKEEI